MRLKKKRKITYSIGMSCDEEKKNNNIKNRRIIVLRKSKNEE